MKTSAQEIPGGSDESDDADFVGGESNDDSISEGEKKKKKLQINLKQ